MSRFFACRHLGQEEGETTIQEIPGIETLAGQRVFVTGATCPLGREVCRILAANNVLVIALVRDAKKVAEPIAGTEYLVGDCEDPSVYGEGFKACSFVVHIAGMRYASAVIRACAGHHALSRILFISSTRIHYSDALLSNDERRGKGVLQREEEAVATSQLPWTLLRPTLIHSQGDRSVSRVVRRIRQSRFVPLPGSGKAAKQPISATDLAVSTLKALVAPGTLRKSYDVPGLRVSVYDMIQSISETLGRPVTMIRVPRIAIHAVKTASRLFGSERYRGLSITYLRWYEDSHFSGVEAEADFGHAPRPFAVNIGEQFEV